MDGPILDEKNKGERSREEQSLNPLGLAVGLCIGVAAGAAMGQVAIGISMGVCLGAALALAMERKEAKPK